jgi:hypothetical protein
VLSNSDVAVVRTAVAAADASSDAVPEPLPHCVSWWHASKEVWSHRASRRSLLLSIAAAVAQNLLFSSAVLYYGKEFFSHAGLPHPSRARSVLFHVLRWKSGVCYHWNRVCRARSAQHPHRRVQVPGRLRQHVSRRALSSAGHSWRGCVAGRPVAAATVTMSSCR